MGTESVTSIASIVIGHPEQTALVPPRPAPGALMTTTTPTPPATGRRAHRWAVLGAVLGAGTVVAAVVAAVVWWPRPGAGEPTAWEQRVELNAALAETARAAGLEDLPLAPHPDFAVPCTRNDGRQGVSYWLDHRAGDGVSDPGWVVDTVAADWRDRGHHVQRDPQGNRATAYTTDGAVLMVAASRSGVSLVGSTGCFLRDGAPERG